MWGESWYRCPTSLEVLGIWVCSVLGQNGAGDSQLEWDKDPEKGGIRTLLWKRRVWG